jgi:hypothetical protein
MRKIHDILSLLLIGVFLLSACAPVVQAKGNISTGNGKVADAIEIETNPEVFQVPQIAATPTKIPAKEPVKVNGQMGPDPEDFPQGVNPLTG